MREYSALLYSFYTSCTACIAFSRQIRVASEFNQDPALLFFPPPMHSRSRRARRSYTVRSFSYHEYVEDDARYSLYITAIKEPRFVHLSRPFPGRSLKTLCATTMTSFGASSPLFLMTSGLFKFNGGDRY